MKIVLVTSSGGHLYKTVALKQWWSLYTRVWITRKDLVADSLLKQEKVYYGYFPENRNIFNAARNMVLAVSVFLKEKPDCIFSSGAGVALPFFFVAKLFGVQTVFMETFITVPKTTLTGKIIYSFKLADIFLVQNKKLLKIYPNAVYKGSVL